MRILFTGGSSFTGYWFIKELAAQGHEVSAIFQGGGPGEYTQGARAQRVTALEPLCKRHFGTRFGEDAFVSLIRAHGPFDLLCHHAADVTNYKSPDFDVQAALANNTNNLATVLKALGPQCRLLLTGSVFEGGEGSGSDGLPHFSPYGLSKALSAEVTGFVAKTVGTTWGKFVIPNPFGPLEEPRFTDYLVKNWYAGKAPAVSSPAYVRDNIHVSLLAKAYADFAARLANASTFVRVAPSGYVESQGAFAQRFANELRPRLGLSCELELQHQTEFPEPRVRLNTDAMDEATLGWDEAAAWDELANYYRARNTG